MAFAYTSILAWKFKVYYRLTEFGHTYGEGIQLRLSGGGFQAAVFILLRWNFGRLGVVGAVAGAKFGAAKLARPHFALADLHFFEQNLYAVLFLSALFPLEPNGEVLPVFALLGENILASATSPISGSKHFFCRRKAG